MLGTFLDRMTSFFDQRFILAYVIPTAVFLCLLIGLLQIWFGLSITLGWWTSLAVLEQILIGIFVVFAIIILAYILEMLTAPIVRLYEGYWPAWKLTKRAFSHQEKKWRQYTRIEKRDELANKLRELTSSEHEKIDQQSIKIDDEQVAFFEQQLVQEMKAASAASYYRFPHNPELLKATQLGNVLVAVEEYPLQVYQIDAAIWWPRLAVLLPEAFRVQVDTSLSPMLAALNMSILFTLLSLAGAVATLIHHQWLLSGGIFIGGLFLARLLYFAVVSQAIVYGKLVRVAFDLYRHEILTQMHIPIPESLFKERIIWDMLSNWHYYYIAPWNMESEKGILEPENPLYYDMNHTSTNLAQLQEVSFTIKDFPQVFPKNGNTNEELKKESI
jgi:hypothetical protein